MRVSAQARQGVDFAVILVAVALLAFSVWPGSPTASTEAAVELGSSQYAWVARIVAAAFAIGAVGASQRWSRLALARALLLGATVVLFAGFLIANEGSVRALLLFAVPGAVFLAASFLVGPMPRGPDSMRRDVL